MTLFTAALVAALASAASEPARPAQPAAPVRTIETGYSFTRAPFVNPRVLQEMDTWMSDTGDLVVAINLTDANDSSRFSTWGGEVEVRESAGRCPFVHWKPGRLADGSGKSFGYRYIGMTDAGVQVLETVSGGGGSGVFGNLLFLSVELGRGIGEVEERGDDGVVRAERERVVLHRLGTVVTGDRWDGELAVRGNDLFIGRDEGWFENHPDYADRQTERTLTVDIHPPAPFAFAPDREPCADPE